MKTFLLCSGKGGTGKSTTAVGLLRAFTAQKERVLLLDLDVGLRSLDLLLGVTDSVYNWHDVLDGTVSLQEALCTDESMPQAALLTAPRTLETLPSASAFQSLLQAASKDFSICLLDAPAGLTGLVPILAAVADMALLVATPDAVSARAAATLADSLYDSLPQLATRLILNQVDAERTKAGLCFCADDMVTESGVQLLGAVPQSETAAALSLSGKFDQTTLAAYERMVARLDGKTVPFQEKKIKSVGI